MEIQEALTIVRALADGVNPETGEVLTADVVYQYAPVVRALHRAVGGLEILEDRERSGRTLPANGGKSGHGPKTRRCARNCAEELISTRLPGRIIAPLVRSSRVW